MGSIEMDPSETKDQAECNTNRRQRERFCVPGYVSILYCIISVVSYTFGWNHEPFLLGVLLNKDSTATKVNAQALLYH